MLILSNKKEKINFLAPHEYIARASRLAKEFNYSLSDIYRQALIKVIEELENKKIEKEVEAACRNYYEFNKQFSKNWSKYESKIK